MNRSLRMKSGRMVLMALALAGVLVVADVAPPPAEAHRSSRRHSHRASRSGRRSVCIRWSRGRCMAWRTAMPPAPPAPQARRNTSVETAIVNEVMARVNAERQARGLAALERSPQLWASAQSWAEEMGRSGFRHQNLGALLGQPLFGGFEMLGENIAQLAGPGMTSGQLHLAWMRSDSHRKGILQPGFDMFGVGVYCAPDGKLWATQEFGRRRGSPAPAMTTAIPPLNPIAAPAIDGTACPQP